MVDEIPWDTIVSICVGVVIAVLFYVLSQKGKNQQDEMLTEIDQKAEGIRQKLDEISGEERVFESPPKPTQEIPSFSDSEYKRRSDKCLELLQDKRWEWRSDIMLMRLSRLTKDQFEYFVQNTDDVVQSKKPDIYGNRLFSLRNKLKKGSGS